MNQKSIYLDYQATTPMAPEVVDAMLPWLRDHHYNPHSSHMGGRMAQAAVEHAREQIMALLPKGGRLIFTSGATEAINLAIKGSAYKRFAATTIEHAAILDNMDEMRRIGHEVQMLSVNKVGLVNLDELENILKNNPPALISAMMVNNEIGTIQPINKIAQKTHDAGGLYLCDAVQAYGRMAIDEGPDMIAISAHKIYGPKGVGALWVRDDIHLNAIQHGGEQEMGMRSGTLSPALCVGFGKAAEIAKQNMETDNKHVRHLWDLAVKLFASWDINGDIENRYYGNFNIRKDGLDADRLISEARNILFSAGSACASGSGRPSHVLKAIGLSDKQAKSSIRLGFGRYTSMEEIDKAAQIINQCAQNQEIF
ncbi:aminotransferase [Sphingorhabdus lutea]|uniref:Cysteine desulfurase n=1 Tax=Sphingorhabdus lutea TaxID=1913578 RepID=A0A1L3JCS3_9SPHN|nr:cysteine desulfurase family protein [Sphingorhabdus lutea]APG62863.1 aminotransferase [Sphingorhabdus lutea]